MFQLQIYFEGNEVRNKTRNNKSKYIFIEFTIYTDPGLPEIFAKLLLV